MAFDSADDFQAVSRHRGFKPRRWRTARPSSVDATPTWSGTSPSWRRERGSGLTMSANGASPMSADLEGKVVLVTGAGSGIGEACAHSASRPAAPALPSWTSTRRRPSAWPRSIGRRRRVPSRPTSPRRTPWPRWSPPWSSSSDASTAPSTTPASAARTSRSATTRSTTGDGSCASTSTACSCACARRSARCARTAAAPSSTWPRCWRPRAFRSRSPTSRRSTRSSA